MITYQNPYKVDGEGSGVPPNWDIATEYEDDDKISHLAHELSSLTLHEIKELQIKLRNQYTIKLILIYE